MSVSANTTRLRGLADSLRGLWPGGSATPAGGPAGNAVLTLPITRAPITYFLPVGLNPSRNVFGSNSIWNRSTGSRAASGLDTNNGSHFVCAPFTRSRVPAVATLIVDQPGALRCAHVES